MSQSNKNQGVEVVVMRNAFYRDNYRKAVLALLLLIGINCLLAGSIFYQWTHPPQPQYFATTADGRMITWHPLTDPVVPDSYVLQWSANSIRKAFSLDFIHYRQQLQDASNSFTPSGWQYFLQALQKSDNLQTLINLKMVSNATITGAPQIVQKEIVDGRFAWKIQLPILVTYTNGKRSIPTPLIVTLIVVRMPVQQDPDRIAINNFLPVPQQSQQDQVLRDGSGL